MYMYSYNTTLIFVFTLILPEVILEIVAAMSCPSQLNTHSLIESLPSVSRDCCFVPSRLHSCRRNVNKEEGKKKVRVKGERK